MSQTKTQLISGSASQNVSASTVVLSGATSGTTTLSAPAVAGSNTLTLPTGNGTSGQFLQTNGSGAMSWGSQRILQVVQAVKTDSFSSTSQNSFTDITGFSVSITPSSSTNKVLVLANLNVSAATADMFISGILVRGSTNIGIGDALGSCTRISFNLNKSGNDTNFSEGGGRSFIYLDSPATTSSTTYKVQITNINSTVAGTWYVNRALNTSNNYNFSSASSITAIEVAA